MPTLLANERMHPALVARIEASVAGRRVDPETKKKHSERRRRGIAPGYVAMARFGFVLIAIVMGYLVFATRKNEKKNQNLVRADLLAMREKYASQLAYTDETYLVRAEKTLIGFSRTHNEVLTDEVKTDAALTATLTRPIVYVRGGIGSFASSNGIASAARASVKDAFVLCLLSPPASRQEKAMLPKMRVAYGDGGALEAATPNVRKLWDAAVGLPYLQRGYKDKIEKAEDSSDLLRLRRDLERAPLAQAVEAAKSPLLLVVLDEPGAGAGPTELDGERTHWVRVGLLDLKQERTIMSTRRLVDPSWISLAKKSAYASGLDSCQLAFDIRESVKNGR